MKKLNLKNITVSVVFLLATPLAHAGDWTGNNSGYLGTKSIDDNNWPDLDHELAMGAIIDIRQQDWPVSIALDFVSTGDRHDYGSQEDETTVLEGHIGIRKVFTLANSPIRPYLGGGMALVAAEISSDIGSVSISEDDHVIGKWIGIGSYFDLGPQLHMGIDMRYSAAEVRLSNQDRDIDGVYTGVSLGYHW